jgi:hypothetical protein
MPRTRALLLQHITVQSRDEWRCAGASLPRTSSVGAAPSASIAALRSALVSFASTARVVSPARARGTHPGDLAHCLNTVLGTVPASRSGNPKTALAYLICLFHSECRM